MAKDLVNTERANGVTQRVETPNLSSVASTPTGQNSASFTRYWQHPTTEMEPPLRPNPSHKKNARTVQPGSRTTMSVFQTPISSSAVTTIELLKTEDPSYVVELQSSDEDEVIEVALPPKPTITIESSDEEPPVTPAVDVVISPPQTVKEPSQSADAKKNKKKQKNKRRATSTSPVPSVVSSVSDDFIRGDCITFNISRRPEVERFDFNLHGADLLDQHSNSLSRSAKRKKRKKSKDKTGTLSPRAEPAPPAPAPAPEAAIDRCFTTPQSNAKRKNSKNYTVSECSVPDPDVYESDSNQSAFIESVVEETTVELNSSKVGEKSKETVAPPAPPATEPVRPPVAVAAVPAPPQLVDLTSQNMIMDPVPVEDNLVMGNVTGLEPATDTAPHHSVYRPHVTARSVYKKINTVAPQQSSMDNEARDIAETVYPTKQSFRREMDRFYNESWGGENFNHFEIQKSMSRDKGLWAIIPRDKFISSTYKRRCHYCNQVGHSYDRCRLKPRICHMCGSEGHYETRCPHKMCLKCGAPNMMYSIHCRNCVNWNRVFCDVCQMYGHPVEHCPDLWRRYHSTVENDGIVVRQTQRKRKEELFCSGCARRGHLAHMCHQLTFSNLPVHSPFVFQYRPVYPPSTMPEYPTVGPTGRYFSLFEQSHAGDQHMPSQVHHVETYQNNVPINRGNFNQAAVPIQNVPNPSDTLERETPKCPSVSNDQDTSKKKRNLSGSEVSNKAQRNDTGAVTSTTEKTDEVLQDSEVSNTSEVVTVAKIYIDKDTMVELKKAEGRDWLAAASARHHIRVTPQEQPLTLLNVSGLPANQEAFQTELKEWNLIADNSKVATEETSELCINIPHKKTRVLRLLNKAFASLQSNLGQPSAIYKELNYLQIQHKKLLKTKIISPKKLNHSRTKINKIIRSLNIILLGQAGLANGSQHVAELYSLQDILIKYRKTQLTNDLRHRVGEHYHYVFSTNARDDYADLLTKYYKRSNVVMSANKPKVPIKSSKKKKNKPAKNSEGTKEAPVVDQANKEMEEVMAPQPTVGNTEYMESQIQSYLKKLRKRSTLDEQKEQRRVVLLKRLRKFQVQSQRFILFPKQCIQLNKLMAEVKKFLCSF